MNPNITIYSLFYVLLSCLYLILTACQSETANQQLTDKMLSEQQLAQKYCSSCHPFISPKLLPKQIWLGSVLPEMRRQMLKYYHFEDNLTNAQQNTPNATISTETWQKIEAYFAKEGVDSLPTVKKASVKLTNKLFRNYFLNYQNDEVSNITMLKIDTLQKLIYIGESIKNRLTIFDIKGKKYDSLKMLSPVSDIVFGGDKNYLLTIGKMNPNDDSTGVLSTLPFFSATSTSLPFKTTPLLMHLNRPVSILSEDLNQDESDDMLIAEYGHEKGSLAWFEIGKVLPTKHILNAYAGNLKSYIVDMNGDGLSDVVSLVAQMNEGIFIYFNKGKGNFEEKSILKFLPIHGSTDFELLDFDKDGDLDILLTNGDNADYSITPKPYHGIRIYLNDGQNNFTEKYFYPLNGAFKLRSRDYDQDGDIDIALISFFPNYDNLPNESFVYLENTTTSKDFTFEALSFKDAINGHWFVMEAMDIDQDGDIDIILGSLTYAPVAPPPHHTNRWASFRSPFFILENLTIKIGTPD